MATIVTEGISESGREAYLQELYRKVLEEHDQASFVELGQIAAGRIDLPLARELFQKLDAMEGKING